jgi:hypothetical protein
MKEKIRDAVADIAADLADRRGLGDEWDQLDAQMQHDIMDEWVEIIERALEEQ